MLQTTPTICSRPHPPSEYEADEEDDDPDNLHSEVVGDSIRLPLQGLDDSQGEGLGGWPAVEEGRDEDVLQLGRVEESEGVEEGNGEHQEQAEVQPLQEATTG